MPSDYSRFYKLRPDIEALPQSNILSKKDLLTEKFRLYDSNYNGSQIGIYYIPFDYINETAKVTIIGITPGWTQMEIAYRMANQYLHDGLSPEDVLKRVCDDASFAGSMRTNLVQMLDGIGLADALKIRTSDQLFGEHSNLAHTTSAIRYPVFINGENYSGSKPGILEHPVFRKYVIDVLSEELLSTSNALVIPLGKTVSEAVQLLIDMGKLEKERCLPGFPHPSGANGHRVRIYNEKKQEYASIIKNWFADN